MKRPIDKTCSTCGSYEPHCGVCCNSESEHRADFTNPEDSCPAWHRQLTPRYTPPPMPPVKPPRGSGYSDYYERTESGLLEED